MHRLVSFSCCQSKLKNEKFFKTSPNELFPGLYLTVGAPDPYRGGDKEGIVDNRELPASTSWWFQKEEKKDAKVVYRCMDEI